jgi:hypothetical protein
MFRNSSTGSTRRIRSVHVVAAGALVLAMSGSATAAMVITGKQIKNNTVTSKDIKNGSLQVKDFKSSEATKLRGPAGANGTNGVNGTNGTNGTNGAAGASAFAPPPSGTVIKGGGILNVYTSGATAMRNFAPLPFTTAAPLSRDAGRNLYFGSQNAASLGASEIDAVKCPGTAAAPNPTAGNMCVYVSEATNVAAASSDLWPGPDDVADGAESNGFYVISSSSAAGNMLVRYVWAYKAP